MNMDYGKFLEHLTLSTFFPPLWNALSAEEEQRKSAEMAFVKEVIVKVNEDLFRLEKKVDQEYMKSDDFLNFLHKTLKKAVMDLRKEKMRMFANIIVNSTLKGNANTEDRWKYLYAEAIDKIDETLFAFLSNLKSRCITKGHELDLGWTGKESELEAMGIDLITFRTNGDYLMSTGLMTRIHQSRYNKETHGMTFQDEYYVTEFGLGFIEYVREQDSVEDAEAELL